MSGFVKNWITRPTLAASNAAFMVGSIAPGAGSTETTVADKLAQNTTGTDKATGDGVTSDNTALQLLINESSTRTIDLLGKTYSVTSKLVSSVAGQTLKNGTLLFNGTVTDRLLDVTASDVRFKNIKFKGNAKQPRSALVYVAPNVDATKFHKCEFSGITAINNGSTVLNQTYGLLISPYGVTDFEIYDCKFKDLIKYNDGVNGTPTATATVGLGFIGGICFLPEDLEVPAAAQPIPTRGKVDNCVFNNIQTILAAGLSVADQSDFNDADAIRTYSEPGGATRLEMEITNCTFRDCSKRALKLLASGTTADNSTIYAAGMQYGMVGAAYVGNKCSVRNTRVIASAAKPMQTAIKYIVSGDTTQQETLIEGLFVSHCIVGFGLTSNAANAPITGLTVRDVLINQALDYGVVQSVPLPTTQSGLTFENVQIFGSGNAASGITIPGATDGTGGCTFKNVFVNNGSVDIGGVNNDVDGLKVTIDNTSFVGTSTSARLFRIGQDGSGGYQNLKNVFINAYNINTTFLNATRTEMILFLGDNCEYSNIRIKVPDALTEAYKHFEFYGTSWDLDGLVYDGPGMGFIGQSVASTRWSVKNAVRLGSGASSTTFLYTNNASTGNGLFENITDLRPTTAPSITINNGLGAGNRFIVTNVASKSSNATIVQNGGLATVTNANYFP